MERGTKEGQKEGLLQRGQVLNAPGTVGGDQGGEERGQERGLMPSVSRGSGGCLQS